MTKILFLTLLATLLLAENPRIYSTLGDVIYDNVEGIDALKNIQEYSTHVKEIDEYVSEVKRLKADGFAIERGDKKFDKYKYLNRLRLLSKTDEFFTRDARIIFNSTISDENSELFSKLLNTGLIETKKYKNEILTYYLLHIDEVPSSTVIEEILNEGKKKKKSTSRTHRSKKQIESSKISRIRNSDKRKRERIEKELQEKVDKEKAEIIDKQRKELSI